MKILIAYDGSRAADAVLGDLQRAGLPDDVEALILTVAEIWMPPPTNGNGPEEYLSDVSPDWIERHQMVKQAALNEAECLNSHAKQSLQVIFPKWKVDSFTTAGSPARKILEKSDEFGADLIVMGAQGKNAVSRLFLGSVSGKILSQAKCSVRIARRRTGAVAPPHPARLIIGFDGSPGAEATIDAVIARNWNKNSEVCLVTAIDPIVPDSIGRFMTSSIVWVEEEIQTEHRWIAKIAHHALHKLKAAGFNVELCVRTENPKQTLINEANQWNADCIFVGANSLPNESERSPIGSICAAVAERAACSVEVVRNIRGC
jgi:nucleotide-binding universal stress UspA family protein